MLGVDLFDVLAAATNANAVRKSPADNDDDPNATSDEHWHPTTAQEMEAFVGINIAMGITDLPEYRDYWAEDPTLHDAFTAGVMSRRRYEKLVQYFHCSLAADEEADDKLAKVWPLITVCTKNFHRCLANIP